MMFNGDISDISVGDVSDDNDYYQDDIVILNPATLLKVTLLHWCFSRFLNCTNGTKSRNAPHIHFLNFRSAFDNINLYADH